MKTTVKQPTQKELASLAKQRNYQEVVEFLDKNWQINANDTSLSCIKKLDQAFQQVSQKVSTILVGGTNGKSLTINFAAQLLSEEGLKVGTFYAPHILTYNERISINNETIANKLFAEIANEVINTAQLLEITPSSHEILTITSLLYFHRQQVDVALLEISNLNRIDPTAICSPKVVAITRITPDNTQEAISSIPLVLFAVKAGTHVVSADQSKLNLQTISDIAKQKNGQCSMPIRKLAILKYPFEQLHGRCAALAERICQLYINNFTTKNAIVVSNTLLTKQKGRRGRPTTAAKLEIERNPKKTVDQFWKETVTQVPGRFQLLEKEKPSILLDNAHNLDAFKNLLLGIRLLHYQRPLKGLTLIIGSDNNNLDITEFLKLLRYFFKKTSGQVIVCPVPHLAGHTAGASWDVEKTTNDIKSMKIKAKSSKNFKEAFEAAQKSVDERHGLVVVTGSPAMIAEYWHFKGIKKL